jgi:hypothetical protein
LAEFALQQDDDSPVAAHLPPGVEDQESRAGRQNCDPQLALYTTEEQERDDATSVSTMTQEATSTTLGREVYVATVPSHVQFHSCIKMVSLQLCHLMSSFTRVLRWFQLGSRSGRHRE